MKERVIIDPRFLPKEVKELKISDGRPAFLFLDWEGHLPVKTVRNGVAYCPYCSQQLVNDRCNCFSFRKAEEFNKASSQ